MRTRMSREICPEGLFVESSVDIPAQLWQIASTPTFFDSGDRTFLQRGSPPPPPWRLLPESLFYSNPLTMRAAWRSLPPSQFAGAELNWLERWPVTPEVAGSSPVAPAILLACIFRAFLINTAVQSSELPVL